MSFPDTHNAASAQRPLALIAGPTASGKSGLAVAVAKNLEKSGHKAVIINADASQLYREIPIISAQPDIKERQNIAHKLFGYCPGSQPCTAADWAKDAKAIIRQSHNDNIIPILVGGTGLYIRTLLDGIAPIPEIAPNIRNAVRLMPVDQAYMALEQEDPDAAARLHATDTTRVQRALEIIRSTGRSIHIWQTQKSGGIASNVQLAPLVLLPPRDWLYQRCDRRFMAMAERGALDEVRQLLQQDLPHSAPVLSAIGVPELASHLAGDIGLQEAIAQAAQATRRYAKRQYTWFRNQPPKHWTRWQKNLDNSNIDDLVILLHNLILT